MKSTRVLLCLAGISLVACGTKSFTPSDKHIQQSSVEPAPAGNIPQTSKRAVVLPPPKPAARVETYSVVVTNLPARDILFALARDAKVNIDIHPGVQGEVTLNAINQTLPQILDRISKQIDMRYELDNGNLSVMPDSPFLRSYKIDYVNMSRDADGGISNATQVGGAAGTSGAAPGGATANNSQLSIKNSSKNHFWETLVKNVTDILRETDKILPEGSSETVVEQNNTSSTTGTGVQPATGKKSVKPGLENSPNAATIEGEGTTVTRRSTFREAASVIASPEAGILTVRATGKQHEKIQDFISQIMRNARRQVLIEATIAEVRLSSNYQQGIDWSRLRLGSKGFQLTQLASGNPVPPATNTGTMFLLNYVNPTSKLGNLSASVSLLESFGDVKVLSSPKISVMNNQTAMLRVVDNLVYFTIKADTTANQTTTTTTYTTTAVTVPTGFTMSVTPQINDSDTVLINLRPSITRRIDWVNDPNPSLANPCGSNPTCTATPIVSRIPVMQTREMESVLKIENNQIAILGGLMQDDVTNLTDSVPLLADIPFVGQAFKNRNDTKTKTELVIFLRPVVIKDASIEGDYSAYRNNLPDENFLNPALRK